MSEHLCGRAGGRARTLDDAKLVGREISAVRRARRIEHAGVGAALHELAYSRHRMCHGRQHQRLRRERAGAGVMGHAVRPKQSRASTGTRGARKATMGTAPACAATCSSVCPSALRA